MFDYTNTDNMAKSISTDSKAKNGRTNIKTPYSSFKDAAKENAKAKQTTSGIQIRLGVMVFGILLASLFYFFPDVLTSIGSTSNSGKVNALYVCQSGSS